MTARQKTIAVGAVYGTFAGAVLGVGVMRLIPHFVEANPSIFRHLPAYFGWAIAFSWPVGPLTGAGAGLFLHWRAQTVASLRRLILETSSLAAAAGTGIIQVLLPVAWTPPRARIALFCILASAGLAALGAWMLKPLYWRKPSEI